jgi:hypothetical protein
VPRRFGYGPRPHRGNHFLRRPRHLDGPHFPRRGSHLTCSKIEVQKIVKTSLGHMVKCWILKIYLTNTSTESSTSSRPM